jgi:hypothetical protein
MSEHDPVEALLAALLADPSAAPELVDAAFDGPDRDALRDALRGDARFGPPLRAAIADPEVIREAPWMVQFLGHLRYAPAVPELVALWRGRGEAVASQAGQALGWIGAREGLEAVAADVGRVVGTAAHVALEAAFALGQADAYDRVVPAFPVDGRDLASLLYFVSSHDGLFGADPRWLELAVEAFRSGDPSAKAAARELLLRRASTEALAERFPNEDAEPTQPAPEALAAARKKLAKLRDALPDRLAPTPPASRPRQLARLEQALGTSLPATLRVFYELFDGIDIPAEKAKDRFVVYPLAEASKELKRWKKLAPKGTPRALLPPFEFPIAPDGYTKAGFSGGPSWAVELPCSEADPPVKHAPRTPKLSTVLRRASRKLAQSASFTT